MHSDVAIITGTRADWGLLSPVASHLKDKLGADVDIVATNMHLLERYGLTVNNIIADGFDIAAKVAIDTDGSSLSTVNAMADALAGMAAALNRLQPKVVAILGDRFEMHSAATAAMMLGIPIAHIAGGETTLGAIDDRIRHSITQMATLHFAQTEQYARRIATMTGSSRNIYNVGALGVWNSLHATLLPVADISADLGFDLSRPTLLVTFHAATADPGDPVEQQQAMLDALDAAHARHSVQVLATYPNNDPRGAGLIPSLEAWASSRPWVKVVPSLGMQRYLSALRAVKGVVGNSSSGIIEVPSMGIPTVDIGTRQQGRVAACSVLHCDVTTDAILHAIDKALCEDFAATCRNVANPYEGKDTPAVIAEKIMDFIYSQKLP